jgi:hypothetical protein
MYLLIPKTHIVPDTYSAIPCMSDQLLWPRYDQISQFGNHVTDYIIQIQQPFLPRRIICLEAFWAAIPTYYTVKLWEKWGEYNDNKCVTCDIISHVTNTKYCNLKSEMVCSKLKNRFHITNLILLKLSFWPHFTHVWIMCVHCVWHAF